MRYDIRSVAIRSTLHAKTLSEPTKNFVFVGFRERSLNLAINALEFERPLAKS